MVLNEYSTVCLTYIMYDTLAGQFIDVNKAQTKRIEMPMTPRSLCKRKSGRPLDPSEPQSAHEVLVALVA